MKSVPVIIIIVCLVQYCFVSANAQEEVSVVQQGKTYINFRIKALDKYNSRLDREQHHLLKQLKRKEKRIGRKLKNSDSAAYARFQRQNVSYDSISKLSDSKSQITKISRRKSKMIDSLKGVASFISGKTKGLNTSSQLTTTTGKLDQLQDQLNYHKYIDGLISQRTNNLKHLTVNLKGNIPALTGIEKDILCSKQKMNVFKQLEEDPSKAEDKALEYLQGTEGFDAAIRNATIPANSMQALEARGGSVADLQKMGYQTKQQVQSALQKKFGNNLGSISKKMGDQMQQWQDKTKELNNIKQTVTSVKYIKHTQRPELRINPMRGLPFWHRVEKEYNFQTTRPTTNGQPAMLELSAMAGYKQTSRLSYGLGIASSIGLGQNWNNVHLSFKGIGLRSYASWKWQYGVAAYAGYERMYKKAAFSSSALETTLTPTIHNTDNYNESILIGLTKSYHVNDKWNGAIQLLYDIWWQQKDLRSPLVLRFSTIAK